MVQDRRLSTCIYLSFLLKIHGKKNSEDSRDLVLGRMTWINESDFNIFLEYQKGSNHIYG